MASEYIFDVRESGQLLFYSMDSGSTREARSVMPSVIKTVFIMLLIILLCALAVEGVSAARLPVDVSIPSAHAPAVRATRNHVDVARIVGVLEGRIGSHRLPEQAKEKLGRMPEQDLRLVASLCDRLAASHDRAGTDLALLLAAVLIVLS